MSQEPPLSLSARRESILRTLIETYYREKEPVGSKLLAERHGESLSSATIRSVLSDLEHDAFIGLVDVGGMGDFVCDVREVGRGVE